MHRELFERAIFIKVTGCSPELHSKRIPLHLFFFFESSTRSYGSFVILTVATFPTWTFQNYSGTCERACFWWKTINTCTAN